jgi:hypothetical protein
MRLRLASLTFAERRNLRSVSARRGAAEHSAVRFGAIDEPKRATGARTALHKRGWLGRHQRRDLLPCCITSRETHLHS